MSKMKAVHTAIKEVHPHDEPIRIEHHSDKGIVVSAFDRTVGRKVVYHVLEKSGNEWKHVKRDVSRFRARRMVESAVAEIIRKKLLEAAFHGLPSSLPKIKYGPRARRPVINAKVLHRSRNLANPLSLRNREMLVKDREMHRSRLGGHRNANVSKTLTRWKNPLNRWLDKGKL